jgi:hypothetical protein
MIHPLVILNAPRGNKTRRHSTSRFRRRQAGASRRSCLGLDEVGAGRRPCASTAHAPGPRRWTGGDPERRGEAASPVPLATWSAVTGADPQATRGQVSRSLRQSCSVKKRSSRARGEPVLAYGEGGVRCLRDSGDNTLESYGFSRGRRSNIATNKRIENALNETKQFYR